MKTRLIQVVVTLSAIALVIIHAVYPHWTIDGITIGLLVVAVLPWIIPLFKSLELPGGWKMEFRDFQRAREKADRAGLLKPSGNASTTEVYSFELVAESDPNLALAGLRIEIEKRLLKLAEIYSVDVGKAGIGKILNSLSRTPALSEDERSVLADMVGLLNSAVHGANVDQRAASWAIEIGPPLLSTLDDRISRKLAE
jgi:hypothetical protein